jgi:hypothetical protein
MTSLDLLDECLTLIYRSRKATLNARARHHEQRLEKRRIKLLSQSRMRTKFASRNDIVEENPNLILDDGYDSPKKESPNKMENKIVKDSNSIISEINGDENESINTTKSTSHNMTNISSVFACFRDEIIAWMADNMNEEKLHDDECRGDFADYLTDKFMCSILDPMPPSRNVSQVRKQIYKIIEDFAKSGTIPKSFEVMEFSSDGTFIVTESPKKNSDKLNDNDKKAGVSSVKPDLDKLTKSQSNSLLTKGKNVKLNSITNESTETKKKEPLSKTSNSVVDRRAQEKKMIQGQYEKLMHQKKDHDGQLEEIQQYEKLNQDIMGLISSIKQKI